MTLESRVKKLEGKQTPQDNYWQQFKGLSFQQFWEAIGEPEKNGKKHPIYPYEQLVYDTIFKLDGSPKDKHVWVKKATGLGITEFVLRLMAWLCCRDDTQRGKEMFIVTGPRIDLAKALIKRMKAYFPGNQESRDTIININNCRIEAFPSHHVATMRGQNPTFIFVDEGDFFPIGQQDEVRTASERYIAKSDPYIVMVSTPNLPDGLFDKLEREPEADTLYRRVFLPYTLGLGTIYTHEEIEKAKKAPSFEREYNLKYGYGVGNIWLPEHINSCVTTERPSNKHGSAKSMGIDMAFGRSGKYAIVVSQLEDQKVQILEAEEIERADPIEVANDVIGYIYKYGFAAYDKIYVDASNPGFIKALKRMLGEATDYQDQIDNYRKQKVDYEHVMRVIPVAFGRENDQIMLSHAQQLGSSGQLSIWEGFTALLTHMRSAETENDGTLDKTENSHDIIDALFLNLRRYRYRA